MNTAFAIDTSVYAAELAIASPSLLPIALPTTASQAERRVDAAASGLGLVVRVDSSRHEDLSRQVRYRDRSGMLQLSVRIAQRGLIEGKPAWMLTSEVSRLDAGLGIELPRRLRPDYFERDAGEAITRLRSLQVGAGGRITGHLATWKRDKGYGFIECLPAVYVYVSGSELAVAGGEGMRRGTMLSFQIRPTPSGRKAVNLRRCASVGG